VCDGRGEEQTQNSSVITGKALERHFALNDALREFALLFQKENNERAAAIVGAAFLDTLLENILINYFRDDLDPCYLLFSNAIEGASGTNSLRCAM
jgi:hypothetical protein